MVVDIPVGYVHSIENTGKTELVTLMWASEGSDASASEKGYAEAAQS